MLRLAGSPRRYGLAFIGMFLYWLGDISCLWAALHAFEVRTPPVAQLIIGYATGYARLFAERDERFVDFAPLDAHELLEAARADPGKEISQVVGGEATVGVFVDVVETLSETYVAFLLEEVGYERTRHSSRGVLPDLAL
jgi:hypothetical protein